MRQPEGRRRRRREMTGRQVTDSCEHRQCSPRAWRRSLAPRAGHALAACIVALQAATSGGAAQTPVPGPPARTPAGLGPTKTPGVRPGIEVLLSDSLALVKGRRLGLITNHTGIDRKRRPTIDLLAARTDLRLVALFSPEHGIRGTARPGERISSGTDARTGLPIHSLYGATRKPTPRMLRGVDILLFDMQDVGARYYTYVSTMALAMQAAGEAGIPFVVLDRPNPIGGDVVQGNVLDTAYATFVGLYPVPMRHGMTPGELARMYVGEFGVRVELHVVPAEGWKS